MACSFEMKKLGRNSALWAFRGQQSNLTIDIDMVARSKEKKCELKYVILSLDVIHLGHRYLSTLPELEQSIITESEDR